MVNDHTHQSHPNIIKRLKRANGHLESVIGMIDQGLAVCLNALLIDCRRLGLMRDH
ncbi:metal-sensing transcriptional repressor [uncultured Marinobacter sp.]|uniref:metal-sensing transcriptional repressor n=1 Tax=uncultured Marinobacter sp. TaxID=187379 RepID=UPI0030C7BD4F